MEGNALNVWISLAHCHAWIHTVSIPIMHQPRDLNVLYGVTTATRPCRSSKCRVDIIVRHQLGYYRDSVKSPNLHLLPQQIIKIPDNKRQATTKNENVPTGRTLILHLLIRFY